MVKVSPIASGVAVIADCWFSPWAAITGPRPDSNPASNRPVLTICDFLRAEPISMDKPVIIPPEPATFRLLAG